MFEGSKVINEWLHDIHHNDTYTGTGVSWFTCFCFHPFSIGILTRACVERYGSCHSGEIRMDSMSRHQASFYKPVSYYIQMF